MYYLLFMLCFFLDKNSAKAGPYALQFVNQSGFSFGEIIRTTTANRNYLTMTTTGVVAVLGTGNSTSTAGTSFPGTFKVKGFPGASINIIAGAGTNCTTTTLAISGITINPFKNSLTNNTTGTTTIGADGYLTFNVTADTSTTNTNAARIHSGDTLGIHSGNFCVAVNYTGSIPSGETNAVVKSANHLASLLLDTAAGTTVTTPGIYHIRTLDFGKIAIPAATAGKVRLTASTNAMSNVTAVSEFSGTQQTGKFKIFGTNNATVNTISIAASTLTGPGTAMTINAFNFSPTAPLTLDATGFREISYGADLAFASNQAAGTYTGTYTITVNY